MTTVTRVRSCPLASLGSKRIVGMTACTSPTRRSQSARTSRGHSATAHDANWTRADCNFPAARDVLAASFAVMHSSAVIGAALAPDAIVTPNSVAIAAHPRRCSPRELTPGSRPRARRAPARAPSFPRTVSSETFALEVLRPRRIEIIVWVTVEVRGRGAPPSWEWLAAADGAGDGAARRVSGA